MSAATTSGTGAARIAADEAAMAKRSVVIAGHKTSISLETAFWRALKHAAEQRGTTVNRLVTEIDADRAGNLSSAIRVFLLEEALSAPARTTAANGPGSR